jgi:hypothetical protein
LAWVQFIDREALGTGPPLFESSHAVLAEGDKHGGVSGNDALAGIKKSHPSQKINEGTFKSTFYKLAGGGKRKVVRRRKPGHGPAGNGQSDHVLKAGLDFIRLAGSVEQAQARLAGLAALIETVKAVQ